VTPAFLANPLLAVVLVLSVGCGRFGSAGQASPDSAQLTDTTRASLLFSTDAGGPEEARSCVVLLDDFGPRVGYWRSRWREAAEEAMQTCGVKTACVAAGAVRAVAAVTMETTFVAWRPVRGPSCWEIAPTALANLRTAIRSACVGREEELVVAVRSAVMVCSGAENPMEWTPVTFECGARHRPGDLRQALGGPLYETVAATARELAYACVGAGGFGEGIVD